MRVRGRPSLRVPVDRHGSSRAALGHEAREAVSELGRTPDGRVRLFVSSGSLMIVGVMFRIRRHHRGCFWTDLCRTTKDGSPLLEAAAPCPRRLRPPGSLTPRTPPGPFRGPRRTPRCTPRFTSPSERTDLGSRPHPKTDLKMNVITQHEDLQSLYLYHPNFGACISLSRIPERLHFDWRVVETAGVAG